MAGGPHDRPDLGFEDVGLFEAHPDGPPAQEGILLSWKPEVGDGFVAPHVQGPDVDRFSFCSLHHVPVNPVLLVLGGQDGAGHERQLRPVKPDAVRSVIVNEFDVGKKAHVGHQVDLITVKGHRRQLFLTDQFHNVPGVILLKALVLLDDGFFGVDKYVPRVPVHDDIVTRLHHLEQLL